LLTSDSSFGQCVDRYLICRAIDPSNSIKLDALLVAIALRLDATSVMIKVTRINYQKMSTELQQVLESISELKTEFTALKTDVETFNTKFDNYQKATQWVVNLAFSLILSATAITIFSSIFRR
jgi:hypothetical protein